MKPTTKTIQVITLMALMAAINVIFTLGATYFPITGFFLVIGLPLTSTLVILFTKARYYPIYFLSTLGLSLLVSNGNIDTTLFYLLPSLVSGFVFGWLLKHNIFSLLTIFIASVVELLMLYITLELINFLFVIDFQSLIFILLGLEINDSSQIIIPLFFYSIALAQTAFSFFIISTEVIRFKVQVKSTPNKPILMSFALLLSALFVLILGVIWLPGAYLLIGPLILFGAYMIYSLIISSKWMAVIIAGGWIVISVFLFAIISPLLTLEASLLPIAIFPLGIVIIYLLDICFPKIFLYRKIKK